MPDDKALTPEQVQAIVKQTPWRSEEILAKSHEALRKGRDEALAREATLRVFVDRLRQEPFWNAHWEMEWMLLAAAPDAKIIPTLAEGETQATLGPQERTP